jgi:hypothetical protein
MKSLFLLLLIIISPILFSIGSDCNEKLPMNEQIIAFVNSNMNKKVGKGECWDLANEALKLVEAKWDGNLKFGRKVDYKKECIYPGDIIQFEKVKVKYTENKITYQESMAHHTAIIYEVKGIGDFILAHQNTAYTGRKIGTSSLNLMNVTGGKISIFRPEK